MSQVSSFARSHVKLIVFLVVLVAAIVAGVIFFTNSNAAPKAEQETSTLTLGRMDIEQTVTATGVVKSADSHSVTTPQASKVASVNVIEGQSVKKGDRLCAFDTSDLDLSIASAQKSLNSAKGQYNEGVAQAKRAVTEAKSQLSYDQKHLSAAVTKAKNALNAAKSAAKTKPAASSSTTPDPLASLQTAYDTAVSTKNTTLRADRAAIAKATDALKTQRLQDPATQAQAELNSYLKQKNDAIIKSPIAGTVTSANAKAGEYAKMEEPLFVVEDISRLEVTTSVPEYDVAKLRVGLGAHVISDAIKGEQWDGVIKSISPVASDTSGNFTVTIAVQTALNGLKGGMSAKVNIVCDSRENVFAVPYGALVERANGETAVYAIEAGGAAPGAEKAGADTAGAARREVIVATGLETDYYVEIIGSTLTEGLVIEADPESLNINAPSESIAGALGY
jgi:RND family efflux transporter MFP subunit